MLSVKFSRVAVHDAMISPPASRARQPCYIIRPAGGPLTKVSGFEANWPPCGMGVAPNSLQSLSDNCLFELGGDIAQW